MDIKRKYNAFDLIRFKNFISLKANKKLKNTELVNKYNKTYPLLTDEQKMNNFLEELGININKVK